MKKIKETFTTIVVPSFLIFSAAFLFTLLIYVTTTLLFSYDFIGERVGEKRLDGFIKISSTAISLTGFVSIIITIIQARNSVRRDLEKNTVDLFREFRNPEFHKTRIKAWSVRRKWNNDTNYRKELMTYMFSKNETDKSDVLSEDSKTVFDLLEFYSIISIYKGNKEVVKKLRYLYYGWWRAFLYSVAQEVDSNRISTINQELLQRTDYFTSISYTENLKNMDLICGFEHYPTDFEFHLEF